MIVNCKLLHDSLARLNRVITPKASPPALSCAHLQTVGSALALTGTDLETWLRTSIPADGSIPQICIPSRPLLELIQPRCRTDREGVVEITVVDDHHVLVAGRGAETSIETMPSQDYPVHPADKVDPADWKHEATWDARAFQVAVGWVTQAAGRDVTRRHLMAVLFDNEAVVATDGSRLHLARLEGLESGPALVFTSALLPLLRIMPTEGTVTASRARDLLRFTAGAWEVTTKTVDERFPPYEMVIPSPSYETFHAIIERAALLDALKRLPRLPAGRTQTVRLRLNGELILERDTDLGCSRVEVPLVDSTHRGPELQIGVDGRYFADALAFTTDNLFTARFGGPLDPIRIDHDDGRVGVIMPLRV